MRITRRSAIRVAGIAGLSGLATAAVTKVLPQFWVDDGAGRGTDDRLAIKNAIERARRAGGGEIHFTPRREYDLGTAGPGETFIELQDLHGIRFVGHGARLRCRTVGSGQTQLFFAQRSSNLAFEDLHARDDGANTRVEWKGMAFLHCETTAGPIAQVRLSRIEVESAVSALIVTGQADSVRARGFTLDRVIARNCYYGACFEENGDDVRGTLSAQNCRRAYFAYGVEDHALHLEIGHDALAPGGDAALLIKRYARDTRRIALSARFEGMLAWRNLAKLEQQPPGGRTGIIEDIALDIDVAPGTFDPWGTVGLGISAYRGDKPVARSGDIWRNVTLSGCLGPVTRATRYYTRSDAASQPIRTDLTKCA